MRYGGVHVVTWKSQEGWVPILQLYWLMGLH